MAGAGHKFSLVDGAQGKVDIKFGDQANFKVQVGDNVTNNVQAPPKDEKPAQNIQVGGNLNVDGDFNMGSAGQHVDMRDVTAHTINMGHIDSEQKNCTSHVSGTKSSSK